MLEDINNSHSSKIRFLTGFSSLKRNEPILICSYSQPGLRIRFYFSLHALIDKEVPVTYLTRKKIDLLIVFKSKI